ncbi:hypothetical protein B0T11DRAFT_270323 [Plectosphaerella cucumerina]|uniref:DUF6594 domain-containing protein n=1 Tax=Plectosphaerella cucumerina TaxID=40658 RepID=A0A8K0TQC0_9PEZI|nr:hypothetical protein B0T11DRAFT_270323 [Plectosphaerella cucumerina]
MDVENTQIVRGFPTLARKIAAGPDYETFIFRKFDQLSARNLLHLESRLTYLEWKLTILDEKAALNSETENIRSVLTWEAFENKAREKGSPEYQRMEIAEEISRVLKDYHEALLRQSQVAALEEPRQRPLNVARSQMFNNVYDPHGNKVRSEPLIMGDAAKRLDDENRRDLAAVRRPPESDLLSRFLQDHWMFKTRKLTDETEYIVESHIHWVGAVVSTLVAAILLLGAIFLLRALNQEDAQLGVIAMFTVLFSASVRVMTNARRAEIFASTAAYAAVLVVFVSTSPPGSGQVCCSAT